MLPHCQGPTAWGQRGGPPIPRPIHNASIYLRFWQSNAGGWDLPTDNGRVTGNTPCCWPCSRGVQRSGTTGEAEQEGGHIQLSPVQPSTITTLGYLSSRIPQSPPWPVQAPALPKICCSLTPKPGHQRCQSTGAVKSQVPAGTVPHDRGVPEPLGH